MKKNKNLGIDKSKDLPVKEATAKQYQELQPKYGRLAQLLAQDLETFLEEAGVDVLSITYRVKDLESLWDKIQRKRYTEPFSQIEDMCGLRIICFYPSDLERISALIRKEFLVTESEDKADLLGPDRFGYRSLHFIVKLKKQWLSAPQYRGLGALKAEIQVRTILMHAWAGLSHKLAYKRREQVPDQFQRKLFQLSALFEVADEQFDELKKEKLLYQEQLIEKKDTAIKFDISQPLNIDTLQAFSQFYFPQRREVGLTELLDEISRYGITIKDLADGYEKTKEILPLIEEEIFEDQATHWNRGGVIRVILDLTHDSYWKDRKMPQEVRTRDAKWRRKLKSKIK